MTRKPNIRFDEFSGDYRLQDQELLSKFQFKLQDDLKLSINHRTSDGALKLALEHDKWELSYDTATRDIRGQYKHKLSDNSHVKVVQAIPDNKWASVPNPIVELQFRAVDQVDYKDEVELRYDFSRQVGELEYEAKIRGDHKIGFVVDSAGKEDTAILRWKTEVHNNRLVKEVGASYNRQVGVGLKYKAHPTDNTTIELTSNIKSRSLYGELEWKPEQLENTKFILGTRMLNPINGEYKFEDTTIGVKIEM